MKKQLLLITGLLGLAAMAFGGGIVTNTNQSAAWVRTMVRDASTDADAVYFNPAGLIKLTDGFHFSLNSQTIFQNKDVTSDYPLLNGAPKKYHGEVKAPVFPGFYATWKKNKLALSFGFNPVGGGGGAEFAKGLPSFEQPISDLVPVLSTMLAPVDELLSADQPYGYGFDPKLSNITAYSADNTYFKGTSVFFGYQLGATYKINEMFGVYAGIRYVSAKNTYKGYIHDVMIEAAPEVSPAPIFNLPVAGSYTPGDYMRAVSEIYGLSMLQIGTFQTYGAMLDAATDVEVDAEETGHGITPILGLNMALNENLNIGLKYEFKTTMDLKQTINDGKDGGGMFVQDSTVHSDMPAMISAGIKYRFIPKMAASAGMHYYFDKNVNYGKTSATGELVSNDKVIEDNCYELAFGIEYDITDKFIVSAGYLFANSGVMEDYQSDLSFDLTSSTFGFGFGYKFSDHLMVNLGGAYTTYQEGEKNYMHSMSLVGTQVPVKDTYSIDNLFFGIGLDFSF